MSKLIQKAESLYNQGLQAIPVKYKIPLDRGWRDDTREPNGQFERANGIGVVLGREITPGWFLHALDVDCLLKQLSNDFFQVIQGTSDEPVPYRIGRMPKFLVPVLIDEPLKKVVSNEYHDGTKLELLGEGQQFVAYGHPSEGKSYSWHNGSMDIDKMPRLNADKVTELMREFEVMASNAGMVVKSVASKPDDLDDDFLIDVPANREDISDDEVVSLLAKLDPNPLDYDRWISVGMAIHHQTEGRGYQTWLKWSERSEKHDVRQMKLKWDSFANEGRRVVTLATVRHYINQQSVVDMGNPFEEITDNVDKNEKSQDFLSAEDITDSELSQFWQVEDILEKGSICQVFGPSFSGKSYFVMYLAACMSAGEKFGDKRTIKSRVTYVYGEGNHGIKRRLRAIKHAYPDLNLTELRYSKDLPNFMDDKSFKEFGHKLKKSGGTDVIIVDTLARAMSGGDENSGVDMGIVSARLSKLRDYFGCSVVVVHHTGHSNQDRGRGHSSNYAALDNEIKVEKGVDGVLEITSTKAKDTPEYKPMHFKFVPVNFDVVDNFGRQLVSSTLEFVENYGGDSAKKPLSKSGEAVFSAFIDLVENEANHCVPPADFAQNMGLDAPAFGIASVTVREQFNRRERNSENDHSNLRIKWRRGLEDAVSKGYLAQLDEIIVRL